MVQTVLPSTGHIALFPEQMLQHLPRCVCGASHHLPVSQLLGSQCASFAGTPCHGQVGCACQDLRALPPPPVRVEGQEHKEVNVHS